MTCTWQSQACAGGKATPIISSLRHRRAPAMGAPARTPAPHGGQDGGAPWFQASRRPTGWSRRDGLQDGTGLSPAKRTSRSTVGSWEDGRIPDCCGFLRRAARDEGGDSIRSELASRAWRTVGPLRSPRRRLGLTKHPVLRAPTWRLAANPRLHGGVTLAPCKASLDRRGDPLARRGRASACTAGGTPTSASVADAAALDEVDAREQIEHMHLVRFGDQHRDALILEIGEHLTEAAGQ